MKSCFCSWFLNQECYLLFVTWLKNARMEAWRYHKGLSWWTLMCSTGSIWGDQNHFCNHREHLSCTHVHALFIPVVCFSISWPKGFWFLMPVSRYFWKRATCSDSIKSSWKRSPCFDGCVWWFPIHKLLSRRRDDQRVSLSFNANRLSWSPGDCRSSLAVSRY